MTVLKPKAVIGVDPGDSGAICLVADEPSMIPIFYPTTMHLLEMVEVYRAWQHQYDIRMVVVEDVHAIPGAAAGTSFKFGANTERMAVVPATLGLPVGRIKVKEWQKIMDISVSRNLKGASRKKAIKTKVAEVVKNQFPTASINGPKGGLLDGRSDALAIAEASRRKFSLF